MPIPVAAEPKGIDRPSQRIQFVDDKGCLTSPAQLFLQQLADAIGGSNPVIPSSAATVANAITISLNSSAHGLTQYFDYAVFSFVADTAGTAVTAQIGNLNALPVYNADGVTPANTVAGTFYFLIFSDAVNGGNGGFILK